MYVRLDKPHKSQVKLPAPLLPAPSPTPDVCTRPPPWSDPSGTGHVRATMLSEAGRTGPAAHCLGAGVRCMCDVRTHSAVRGAGTCRGRTNISVVFLMVLESVLQLRGRCARKEPSEPGGYCNWCLAGNRSGGCTTVGGRACNEGMLRSVCNGWFSGGIMWSCMSASAVASRFLGKDRADRSFTFVCTC